MNPSQPPQNNNRVPKLRPPLPKPSLTPEERKIWLASHNAPADMLMISHAEFRQMTVGMINGQRTLLVLKATVEETANHLDNYWRTQPDLPTAARAAVHDARRFHRIAERCLNDVDSFLTLTQSLANHMDDPTGLAIIYEEANRIGETLAFIKEQMALRLEPEITKPQEEPKKP